MPGMSGGGTTPGGGGGISLHSTWSATNSPRRMGATAPALSAELPARNGPRPRMPTRGMAAGSVAGTMVLLVIPGMP